MASPPTIRFLLAHPAHLVACGFGSGLSPRAPGTVGTLFAWASFPLLRPWMSDLEFLGLLFLCFVGGVLAVHKTGADLGTYTVRTDRGQRLQFSGPMHMPWHFTYAAKGE